MKQRKTKEGGFKTSIALMLALTILLIRICSSPPVTKEDVANAPLIEIIELPDYRGELVRVIGVVSRSYSLNTVGGIFVLTNGEGHNAKIQTKYLTPQIGESLEVFIYVKSIVQINQNHALIGIEKGRFLLNAKEVDESELDFISIK